MDPAVTKVTASHGLQHLAAFGNRRSSPGWAAAQHLTFDRFLFFLRITWPGRQNVRALCRSRLYPGRWPNVHIDQHIIQMYLLSNIFHGVDSLIFGAGTCHIIHMYIHVYIYTYIYARDIIPTCIVDQQSADDKSRRSLLSTPRGPFF